MEYNIIVSKEENPDFYRFIQRRIKEYNDYTSPYHRDVREPGAVQAVNIIAENLHEEWIGGLTAEIYWNWMEIKYFWLHSDFRKKGIGTIILKEAEKAASALGCYKVFLATFEFQGRVFMRGMATKLSGSLKIILREVPFTG